MLMRNKLLAGAAALVALALVGPAPGPRLERLAARARALLADPAEAEAHFTAGLAGLVGET